MVNDSGPVVRPQIASLPAYVPGARPAPGSVTHKLTSNESPFPLLPSIAAAISRAALDVNRYPDMANQELSAAIGDLHGLPAEWVVPGNGSVAVLESVLDAICEPGDDVVFAWRSFEAYPIVTAVAGANAIPVPVTADGRHDLAAMAAVITATTRAVLLCSPNNPTGPALRREEVTAFLAGVPERVLVLLDEAYAEFVRDPDAVEGEALLAEHPNVVVLRTFSKAYGLAGLRVGYALARPELATGLRAATTPFGVNALAQAAALAALAERETLLAQVAELVAERERVVAALADQGWTIPDAQGNFVWLGVGERALAVAGEFEKSGVLVRPFRGDGVRVSIAEPAANDAFLAVAARLVGE